MKAMNAARACRADRHRRSRPPDALDGLSERMRDALEAARRSMLLVWDAGEVRSVIHPDRAICSAAEARALLGRALLATVGDGDVLRLSRRGERLARLSAARRANFQKFLRKERRI